MHTLLLPNEINQSERGFMQEAIRIQLPHLLGNYQGNICVFDLNRDSAFCKMCQNGSRIICSAARGLKQQATLLVESFSYFDHRVFDFHIFIYLLEKFV